MIADHTAPQPQYPARRDQQPVDLDEPEPVEIRIAERKPRMVQLEARHLLGLESRPPREVQVEVNVIKRPPKTVRVNIHYVTADEDAADE